MLISLKELGHEYMVSLIDKLAGTLYNYASSRGIAVDMEYCRKIMWGGTFSTLDSYEKECTPDERDEISAIVNAELNNKSYTYQLSDGSIQTTTAEGKLLPAIAVINILLLLINCSPTKNTWSPFSENDIAIFFLNS